MLMIMFSVYVGSYICHREEGSLICGSLPKQAFHVFPDLDRGSKDRRCHYCASYEAVQWETTIMIYGCKWKWLWLSPPPPPNGQLSLAPPRLLGCSTAFVYCLTLPCVPFWFIQHQKNLSVLTQHAPMCGVKPLQMVKNVAMCAVFKQPQQTHISWCWWNSNGWCIMIYSLKLTYREPAGSAPSYMNSVVAAAFSSF